MNDTKKARELANEMNRWARGNMQSAALLQLADEVDRLRAKDRRDMDDDLAWALKGKCELMEREDEVWKPLLAAAKKLADQCPREQSKDAWDELDEAIAACEEKL